MKIGHLVRTLGSGAALYLVMAACGASDRAGGMTTEDGGAGGLDGEAIVDAMLDELGNPVKDAKADPLPPDVATEPCNKTGMYGATAANFATHDYPGKTLAEMGAVQILGHLVAAGRIATVGGNTYDQEPVAISANVRPGSVVVFCGTTGGVQLYDSVTFVMPR